MSIQEWSIIATLVFGLVTALVALCTLHQNSRMIEESTRPYICICFDIVHISMALPRFVIKNYGKTGASITDFTYPEILKSCDFGAQSGDKEIFSKQFELVKGFFLAPGQAIAIDFFKTTDELKNLDFTISYKAGKKEYDGTYTLNVGASPHCFVKPTINDKNALPMIGKVLEEICTRL